MTEKIITEIVYTWPDGREEVRYRRTQNSTEAMKLLLEVLELQLKHGNACPYSFRHVPVDPRKISEQLTI